MYEMANSGQIRILFVYICYCCHYKPVALRNAQVLYSNCQRQVCTVCEK